LWAGSAAADVPPNLPVVAAQVSSQTTGSALPPGFLGFSFEIRALHVYTGRDPGAINPVLVQLIKDLNPGQSPVLRIGGNSSDQSWWPTPGVIPPGGINYAITKGWLRTTRAFADATGAKLIIGVNLAANRPGLAATEARAIVRGVGNEADLYGRLAWYKDRRGRVVFSRPHSYSFSDFVSDFNRWRVLLPQVALAGPAFAGVTWMAGLNTFLTDEPRVDYVTFHRYPLRACVTDPAAPSYASIPNLLQDRSSAGLAAQVAPLVAIAHAHAHPFRLDELNSASCSGRRGMSDTFASSLWVLDTLFNLAATGVDGIDLHTLPGAPYEPFVFTRKGQTWNASVKPVYYGMLMFAEAFPPGAQLLQTDAPAGAVKVWATRGTDGRVRIVMINKDPTTSVDVHVALPGPATSGTVQTLSASGLSATSGISLGGRSFGTRTDTGRLVGQANDATVDPLLGYYSVQLPAASAALLVK
jgi:hypothetical protein